MIKIDFFLRYEEKNRKCPALFIMIDWFIYGWQTPKLWRLPDKMLPRLHPNSPKLGTCSLVHRKVCKHLNFWVRKLVIYFAILGMRKCWEGTQPRECKLPYFFSASYIQQFKTFQMGLDCGEKTHQGYAGK